MFYVFLGIYYFVVMLIAEKVITNIDKKERKKISNYEEDFIKKQEEIFTKNKNFDYAVRKREENESNFNTYNNISSSSKSRINKM